MYFITIYVFVNNYDSSCLVKYITASFELIIADINCLSSLLTSLLLLVIFNNIRTTLFCIVHANYWYTSTVTLSNKWVLDDRLGNGWNLNNEQTNGT